MKRSLLVLVLLAVAAAPALAYVQPGHLPGGQRGHNDVPRQHDDGGLGDVTDDPYTGGHGGPSPGETGEGDPTRPVPEPGTMALAAMGLAALGAASRRRRNR